VLFYSCLFVFNFIAIVLLHKDMLFVKSDLANDNFNKIQIYLGSRGRDRMVVG
jgi:hypothetical protein